MSFDDRRSGKANGMVYWGKKPLPRLKENHRGKQTLGLWRWGSRGETSPNVLAASASKKTNLSRRRRTQCKMKYE